MHIQSVSSGENSFKGALIVKDLKADKVLKFKTTKEAGEQMYNTFSGKDMLNERTFLCSRDIANDLLVRLKKFVAFFAESVGGTFDKELTYPSAEKFSARYKVVDKLAEIDVPEHFSIKLEV